MFCAGFRPSSTSNSVASAACSPMVGTSARSAAVKFSSTSAAGSLRPAGGRCRCAPAEVGGAQASGSQLLTLHVRFLWRRSGLAVDPDPEAFFELSHLRVVEFEDRGAGVASPISPVASWRRHAQGGCRTAVPTSRNTAGVTPGQLRPAQRRRRDTSAARAMSGSTPKSVSIAAAASISSALRAAWRYVPDTIVWSDSSDELASS